MINPSSFVGLTDDRLKQMRLTAGTVKMFLDGYILPSTYPIEIREPDPKNLLYRSRLCDNNKIFSLHDFGEIMYPELLHFNTKQTESPDTMNGLHDDGNDSDLRPSPKKRFRANPSDQSHSLVPSWMSLEKALVHVRMSLPPALQDDDRFVGYAARRAVGMQQTAKQFFAWVDREEERRAEEKRIKGRRIRERDVRNCVDENFSENFDTPCSYNCGTTISVDRFYVVRDGDMLNTSCSKCYRKELKMGKPGKVRVADRARIKTWLRHNGRHVEGNCFHCGEDGRPIHFYLDSWHAGHDVAASNGGGRDEKNMAPMHPTCNWDQGIRTFADY